MKSIHNMQEASNLKIFVIFILLIVSIFGYVAINKYVGSDPNETEKDIVEKTGDDTLTDDDAIKLAKEKYYIAVATLTTTKTDIDKVYNQIKTTDIVLTDQTLIDNLNAFNTKTYAMNASASVVSNYDEAITSNFTDEFITNNILSPNGFIGVVDDEYYIVKDKTDNYFFKEVELTLVSKSDTELHFEAVSTKYDTSCVSSGQTVPSITCTDTTESKSTDFKLIKESKKWKISEITLIIE